MNENARSFRSKYFEFPEYKENRVYVYIRENDKSTRNNIIDSTVKVYFYRNYKSLNEINSLVPNSLTVIETVLDFLNFNVLENNKLKTIPFLN